MSRPRLEKRNSRGQTLRDIWGRRMLREVAAPVCPAGVCAAGPPGGCGEGAGVGWALHFLLRSEPRLVVLFLFIYLFLVPSGAYRGRAKESRTCF